MNNEEAVSGEQVHTKDLAERFAELMDRVSLQMRPQVIEAWSEIELTMHQFRAVALLRRQPLRITDLAALLGIRLSAATSLLDRLETKRLVERINDIDDRRVVRCQLTPLGQKEADNLWRINREWLSELTKRLSPDELEIIVKAFEVLSAAIARQNAAREEV